MVEITNPERLAYESKDSNLFFGFNGLMAIFCWIFLFITGEIMLIGGMIFFGVLAVCFFIDKRYWDTKYYMLKYIRKEVANK